MRFLYDLVFLWFALVSLPKFLIRLNQSEQPLKMFRERLALDLPSRSEIGPERRVVWLHAVSVGEVMAVRKWIELFGHHYRDWTIALSTTTPTGYTVASKLVRDRVFVFYCPLDLSWAVRRVLSALKPRIVLLMETELWPNLITEASRRDIPIGILNGRISPRSFGRYRWLKPWIGFLLRKLSFCLVQSDRDRNYFLRLGMPEERVTHTGNMKFDQIGTVVNSLDRSQTTEIGIHPSHLILMAGSTSWNEEEMLLRVFERLRTSFAGLQLVLAPRHPEQVEKVERAIQKTKLSYQCVSKGRAVGAEIPPSVLVVDRVGFLASLYPAAHVVVMGGSFVPRGGQNPIEAAVAKKPVVHGPHVFNFHEVYERLDAIGGAVRVQSENELTEVLTQLFLHPDERERMGLKAQDAVEEMKGATMRTLSFLKDWIQPQKQSEPQTVQCQPHSTAQPAPDQTVQCQPHSTVQPSAQPAPDQTVSR